MNLSSHFTLAELTNSQEAVRKGLDNSPTPEILENLRQTAAGLERVREILDEPMFISSGYRSPKVNAAVGGSRTSQHMNGEAVDFTSPNYGTPLQICQAIVSNADFIDFDQLIYEGTWVHISFSDTPRREVLTARFAGGKASYTRGLA